MPSTSEETSPGRRRAALEMLLEITTLLNRGMQGDAAGRGLTVARAEVIWLLRHHGAMRQRDLADALRVSPRNVTGLLDALEEAGFVVRTDHPDDRRATLIRLTDKGEAAAYALAADQAEFASYVFADLSRAELDRLAGVLEKLLARLRNRSFSDLRSAALGRWRARDEPETASRRGRNPVVKSGRTQNDR